MEQTSERYSHTRLKAKQRELRDVFPDDLGLRVHRSLSWLGRAEASREDHDVQFIALWIGFNAAYAGDIDLALDGRESDTVNAASERTRFNEFLVELVKMDRENLIYEKLWMRFSHEIRLLLDNQFVFAPFWKHQSGQVGGAGWEITFEAAKRAAQGALARNDTAVVLAILFDRLYVLRNQLIHGGATWNGRTNRDQLRDGVAILSSLLPIFIDLMMDNSSMEWSPPNYPVVA